MALTVDAVVIGSGINGLAAAAKLGKAGWSVALVERNARLGGFIATEERTLPGYRHDTFSSWHPLFVSGPAYAALGDDLHRHGLEYANAEDMVTASVADDGQVVVAHRSPDETAAQFADARDRAAYLTVIGRFLDIADAIGGLIGGELHSATTLRHSARLALHCKRSGVERLLRDLVTSGRSYCHREFSGREVDHLWVPWLLHLGLSPDHASGGFMIPILAATVHGMGLPVVVGGAGRFVDAFCRLFDELGVEVRTSTPVQRILIERGRAAGVIAAGETIWASRAVLASVTPTALYGELLPADAVAVSVREEAARFRYGRGAMQIHVALSAPLGWRDERLARVPLVHVSNGSASTGIACAEAEAGLLPRYPTVVVGQQDVLDPSRVPTGAAALWLQLQEVPYSPVGDAAGELDVPGGWIGRLAERYAHRVLDRIARHAPDLHDKVLAVDVVTPGDLAEYNPNAVAGDPYGGSAELDQSLLWRPLRAAGRHATAVPGLWHIGASTHPGPGLGGGSGHLVAESLTGPGAAAQARGILRRLGR